MQEWIELISRFLGFVQGYLFIFLPYQIKTIWQFLTWPFWDGFPRSFQRLSDLQHPGWKGRGLNCSWWCVVHLKVSQGLVVKQLKSWATGFFCCRKNASPRKNTKFSDFTLLTVRQNSIYIDRRGPPCRWSTVSTSTDANAGCLKH